MVNKHIGSKYVKYILQVYNGLKLLWFFKIYLYFSIHDYKYIYFTNILQFTMIYIFRIILKFYMAWVTLCHNMQTHCQTLYVDMVDVWKHSPKNKLKMWLNKDCYGLLLLP
jgi:hypothetical protein